jgi:hypothetical protein
MSWLHPPLHHVAVQISGANLNFAGDIICMEFQEISMTLFQIRLNHFHTIQAVIAECTWHQCNLTMNFQVYVQAKLLCGPGLPQFYPIAHVVTISLGISIITLVIR